MISLVHRNIGDIFIVDGIQYKVYSGKRTINGRKETIKVYREFGMKKRTGRTKKEIVLSNEIYENILEDGKKRMTYKDMAKKYGMSMYLIKTILNGTANLKIMDTNDVSDSDYETPSESENEY